MNEDGMSPGDESVTSGDGTGSAATSTASIPVASAEKEESSEGLRRLRPYSFAQMILDAGVLSAEQISKAQEAAQREREPLGHILVRDGLVLSRDLATLTALHLGLPMVDLRSETVELDAVRLLPQDIARRYLVLPVRQTGDRMTVAMTDPTDLQTIQDITTRTGLTIEPVIATPEDIQENIEISYRAAEREAARDASGVGQANGRPSAEALRNTQPAEVVQTLLIQALQDRASDIHVEPSETRLRIRYRIDGILHEVMNLPPEMHPAIISRLKIMSGMNIAERRRPQDGQLNFDTGGPLGRCTRRYLQYRRWRDGRTEAPGQSEIHTDQPRPVRDGRNCPG